MANIYSDEEKQMHLNQYKVSGKTGFGSRYQYPVFSIRLFFERLQTIVN